MKKMQAKKAKNKVAKAVTVQNIKFLGMVILIAHNGERLCEGWELAFLSHHCLATVYC